MPSSGLSFHKLLCILNLENMVKEWVRIKIKINILKKYIVELKEHENKNQWVVELGVDDMRNDLCLGVERRKEATWILHAYMAFYFTWIIYLYIIHISWRIYLAFKLYHTAYYYISLKKNINKRVWMEEFSIQKQY